jgi:geranylgeranyl pyrophosphate synthase
MSQADEFFSDVRRQIDAALDRLVPVVETEPTRLYEAIRWSLFGNGKRFRPSLVMASGRELGAPDNKLLGTAAAVEMIHTYSLIHDDLPAMDDDDLRRGRATAHKKFDEATAILAGDALQAMAFETIAADDSLDVSVRLKLVAELAAAASRMVAGQQMDLEAEGRSVELSAIERIHRGKTGALILFSVRAGGSIAGASNAEMESLSSFGEKIGLLFQITDDLLDVTETTQNLGKTAGKDAASGKATYPGTIGIDRSRQLISEVYSEAIDELRALKKESGSLALLAELLLKRSASATSSQS